jgi:putative dehydrogenase
MSTDSGLKVGIIGLGSMGFGMAGSLVRGGFAVTGCDVNAEATGRFVALGGVGAADPLAAATGADALIVVVVNAAQTEAARFRGQGRGAGAALPRRADQRRRRAGGFG